jgi:hypothetical protein
MNKYNEAYNDCVDTFCEWMSNTPDTLKYEALEEFKSGLELSINVDLTNAEREDLEEVLRKELEYEYEGIIIDEYNVTYNVEIKLSDIDIDDGLRLSFKVYEEVA